MSGGDFLFWNSEWHEASKRTAMMNVQAGNTDCDTTMLIEEGQYEGSTNQIGFPIGMYVQFAMATLHSCNQLQTKRDLSGKLASIRQAPDEVFQDFVDRLL